MPAKKPGRGDYKPPASSNKKERAEATRKWLEGKHEPILIGPICCCSQFKFPHPAHTDELGIFEYHRSLKNAETI